MNDTLYPTNTQLPGELHGYSSLPADKYADKTNLNLTLAGGAGAMISTVADLEKYVRALCQGTLVKPGTHPTQLQITTLKGNVEWVRTAKPSLGARRKLSFAGARNKEQL